MKHAFRYSVPTLLNLRGAGLGNEVIPWGKAFIGAQELGLRTLHPPWALNSRGYRHDFGTSLLDWPAHRALRALPHIYVGVEVATLHDDYADVMRGIRASMQNRRGPVAVFHASGMSGGYLGIRRARSFLRASVMSPPHVSEDTYAIEGRLNPERLTVALHIRAGDFSATRQGPRLGDFNTMVPIEWYASVADSLRGAFGTGIEFIILTDDEGNRDIIDLSRRLEAVALPGRERPLLSDIVAMSNADLLVCSVSSLSMFAAFISEKPYVWYGPHLGLQGGLRSIWGHEANQTRGRTASNIERFSDEPLLARGEGVMESGEVSSALLGHLHSVLATKNQGRDLLMYGVVR